MAAAVELTAGRATAGGQRRTHARQRPRGCADRRGLPCGGGAYAFGARSSTSAWTCCELGRMLLTIDVGNTNTVLGVFDGADVVEHWRISTDPVRTADELAVLMQGLLRQSTLFSEPDINGIALCSTVPSVLHELREMCRRYYGDVPAVIVEPGVKTGVPLRYDNPQGGRQRPDHERGGGRAPVRRPGHRGGLRHVDELRRGQREGRVRRRRARAGHRDLGRRAVPPRGSAAEGGAGQAGPGYRQEHGARHCSPGIIFGFAGQVEGIADPDGGRAGARRIRTRSRSSPPAGWRRSSSTRSR